MIQIATIRDVAEVRELLVTSVDEVAREVLPFVATAGALLRGHFLLQGGDHSEVFLRFARLAQDQAVADRIAVLLRSVAPFVPSDPFTVLCPESAGAFLGSAIARTAGGKLAIARVNAKRCPQPALRLGTVDRDKPVIIVNDVVTTADSLRTLIEFARTAGAPVAGAVVFAAVKPAKMQQFALEQGVRWAALVHAQWRTYPLGEGCPGCAKSDVLVPAAALN